MGVLVTNTRPLPRCYILRLHLAMPPRTQILKPHLDEGLPAIQHMSLNGFVHSYMVKANAGERSTFGPHTTFALTGQTTTRNGQPIRLGLHDRRDPVDPETVSQICDIDSAIGFVFQGDRFPIEAGHSLFVHVLNNTDYTLKSSLHVPKFNIPDNDGNPSTIVSALWQTINFCLTGPYSMLNPIKSPISILDSWLGPAYPRSR